MPYDDDNEFESFRLNRLDEKREENILKKQEELRLFQEALPRKGRLAGLDVGTKTIGLALCDSQWIIASPAETIRRKKFTLDLELLRQFVEKQQVKGLVIGLPLNLDGSDSPRTQSVRAFAKNVAPLSLPVLMWDERWSTKAVTRTLLEADASRARRSEVVDKMAAAYILQGAIDSFAMF
ncbi:Holliday junction resolvase YqgF [Zymomonas mobilis subsp. mobilis ZM4 = ATCC 31821]|uniref:Putative pre-16S rRNA nuclease n=1 Tax=Zymomonas mobilis subsp. mobilis (strain ATCC 10988 / DSM 424 / LMG 404 / NCIMB 8938 / NRRL B-806 / ZM1) TaxID=555217 RepID=A0A0H3G0Q8_ZYMMA|nr:Holliday junction resolvase RuvX [Zymomonas mobilis]AAV89409.1 Holliday junction resolvase YqgF [Zymomonas mobilis subsp. mobilis ZM4 = ATCC 31821]ACV75046.1 Holliday junction resolvase YqgF [Zymomonas mobilis subsp. mobilis NCIMB 11163]AEH62352.1 Holliday junction resolvase YqgF [Zymomonas mobilis subsp. mobilis ATCC 10988]AFN56406.1 Holliday junction resolvase [Zymomonas mobilis subsp. mobilis ATCC 29191]AHB09835.1 RNAse H-fold protein YqgF [Zymomonas mobilis subsp. mobilis str. CP4 = NRR